MGNCRDADMHGKWMGNEFLEADEMNGICRRPTCSVGWQREGSWQMNWESSVQSREREIMNVCCWRKSVSMQGVFHVAKCC